MTIQGGKSYRRQTATLFASAIMLAFTLLVPLSVYAETPPQDTPPEETESQQPAPQAPELPYFTQAEAYRSRATAIEFHTETSVEKVTFVIGTENIPGIKGALEEGATHAIWRLSSVPATSGVLQVKIGDNDEYSGPSVHLVEPTLSLAALEVQSGDKVTIQGSVNGILAGTNVLVRLHLPGGVAEQSVSARGDGVPLAEYSLVGVPDGNYRVELIASDGADQLAAAAPIEVTVKKPLPVAEPPVTPDIPVRPPQDVFIPKLEVTPVEALSTQFSIPVTSSLLSALKNSGTVQTIQPRPPEVKGVATEELATLDKIVDLGPTEPPVETPLAPTSGGWSLWGVSWYWWAGSAVTAWAAVVGARWWLRKP